MDFVPLKLNPGPTNIFFKTSEVVVFLNLFITQILPKLMEPFICTNLKVICGGGGLSFSFNFYPNDQSKMFTERRSLMVISYKCVKFRKSF